MNIASDYNLLLLWNGFSSHILIIWNIDNQIAVGWSRRTGLLLY